MRRTAWIFLAAIALPSLVLAWLAVRSARDQQVILEHQQTIISQGVTDALAKKVQERLDDSRSVFIQTTQQLLKKSVSPRLLAEDFDRALRNVWSIAEVGFAVDLNGMIYSPQSSEGPLARTFRTENDRFLGNRENVPVFSLNSQEGVSNSVSQKTAQALNQMNQMAQVQRQVLPQRNIAAQQGAFSTSVPSESDFRRIIGVESSGALARFLEDKLRLMVWYRPSAAGPLVFGAQINQMEINRSLAPLLHAPELHRSTDATYCLAILDDRGRPVAVSRAGFEADWKHPLVATEIGDVLPHWEAALYLVDPQHIHRAASTLQLTMASIILTLVASILLGGWLMSADVRRQMRLAQQKTDFVSNVSHELKTPLTSIRMFADMLAEGRVAEPERQTNYLRIISAESARLTRLINNVLDFARLERGAPSSDRSACDLVDLVREVVDTCRPHLETVGVTLVLEVKTETLPVIGDRDALAQVVLNLLSNAEKYGNREILVRVRKQESRAGSAGSGCVDVLDRGAGIPAKQREAIFRPFYRLDDSLASGVSGSGLGLTLARRMAMAHSGNVTHAPREGGGSCFTLTLPLNVPEESDENQDTRG